MGGTTALSPTKAKKAQRKRQRERLQRENAALRKSLKQALGCVRTLELATRPFVADPPKGMAGCVEDLKLSRRAAAAGVDAIAKRKVG
jgi:hypothetical protein